MATFDSKSDETEDDESVLAASTQENEGFDVAWDWSSPRRNSNQNTMKAKKKRISVVSQRSPRVTFKRHGSHNQIPVFDKIREQMAELQSAITSSANNDVFDDDSIEQELVLCSQKVEEQVECLQQQNTPVFSEGFADDSFDLMLEQIDDDKLLQLTQPPVKVGEASSEAISESESSPVKCSPEEIEQKRLQALKKLEAKKRQQIIEKNRQEALKRLERNKKKMAGLPRKLSTSVK